MVLEDVGALGLGLFSFRAFGLGFVVSFGFELSGQLVKRLS